MRRSSRRCDRFLLFLGRLGWPQRRSHSCSIRLYCTFPVDRIWLSTDTASHRGAMRDDLPVQLRPNTPIIRRDDFHAYVGDAEHPIPLTASEEQWLQTLGQHPTWLHACSECPTGLDRAKVLAAYLVQQGALHTPSECWWLTPDERLLTQPHVAALSAWHSRPETAIAARASWTVTVAGTGTAASALRMLLVHSGLNCTGREEADVVVCVAVNGLHVPEAITDGGTKHGPHLPVSVFRAGASIGPLVIPGKTPCLRCAYLHRLDADPQWSVVASHWASARETWSHDVDPLVAWQAAVAAASMVRTWVDAPDLAVAHVVRLKVCDPMPTISRARSHPKCGCLWPIPQDEHSGAESTATRTI